MIKSNFFIGAMFSGVVAFSGAVQASEPYAGASISFLDYSEDVIDDEASLTAAVVRVGTEFNENLSGEIRVGIGIGDDSIEYLGVDIDTELDTLFGGYLRFGVPVADGFFPYAILGYTRGEITFSASGFGSDTESESDTSFGLGADVDLNQNITFNVEYMNYFDKDGAEIDGFSLGVVSKF
jgi:opacity protein-like surface antigen